MFGNHHFDQVRALFSDQFEPDGDNFIYRKSMKGPPVSVSRSERNELITTFNRHLRRGSWGILIGLFILCGLALLLLDVTQLGFSETPIYIGFGAILTIFMVFYWWAWTAPARHLERRPALGQSRSRSEMRQLMLQRTSYRQLALAAALGVVLPFKLSQDFDVLSGWNRLSIVFCALLLVGSGVQAFRKWRHDSATDNDDS